jgi:hypothetical protein
VKDSIIFIRSCFKASDGVLKTLLFDLRRTYAARFARGNISDLAARAFGFNFIAYPRQHSLRHVKQDDEYDESKQKQPDFGPEPEKFQ